jgi:multimeric flavodoxin WrbA
MFDDTVNEFLDLAEGADGFIFGSPVHFAAASGAVTSFMDRVFYTNLQSGRQTFYLKPAAAVISARRAGTTATFDQLNKYFTVSEMPVISSRYWNMVHGAQPDDVKKDLEGLQTMRILARNMAFFLKCKEAGIKAGVHLPVREKPVFTNFIRE